VDEIGAACDIFGINEKCIQFLAENMKENDSFEKLSVVWRIAFKWILKK
jgi:hypothetical protein